jgi:glycosyltransferase involved in cell wall biosynthesis
MRQTLSHLDNVLVLSGYMKDKFSVHTQSRIYVVPGGVDTREHDVDSSVDTSAPSYILFIGRLHKVKGPSLVLNALPHVINRAGPVSVYLAGTGPEHRALLGMVGQNGLEADVEFLGYVSGDRKVKLIQRAAFVVMPSLYEPFGLVALEAMACGKPVVAARVGGLPDIVRHGETGLLFESGNTAQLADCMVELLLNPELRVQYGRAARQRAESHAWPEIGKQMITVYRECIARFQQG